MEPSCFGGPTWKDFGRFPRKVCWSGLENLAIDHYGLFAGILNQCDPLDTIFPPPHVGDGFQTLNVDAGGPTWVRAGLPGWSGSSAQSSGSAWLLAVGQDYGHVPSSVDLTAVRFPIKLCAALIPLLELFL